MTTDHVPPLDSPARLAHLRADVAAIGPLVDEPLILPWTGRPLAILRPTDLDRLLDRAAEDPEQHLPYWAEIWPSGVALADAILQAPALLRGRHVLELGCGLGITATAAQLAGATLLAADYAAEALALCRFNTLRNAGREPATLQLNWRQPSPALLDRCPGGWPLILAADVLYESRDVAPLLALLDRLVAPGGILWLAEPGRPPARRFLAAARSSGWIGPSDLHRGPWPDPADREVVVGIHRLRRAR